MTPAINDVLAERARQDARWGEQNHPDFPSPLGARRLREIALAKSVKWKTENDQRVASDRLAWDGILLEEVYEALAESDPAALRTELIQVAAVAVAWIEAIDRREPPAPATPPQARP